MDNFKKKVRVILYEVSANIIPMKNNLRLEFTTTLDRVSMGPKDKDERRRASDKVRSVELVIKKVQTCLEAVYK